MVGRSLVILLLVAACGGRAPAPKARPDGRSDTSAPERADDAKPVTTGKIVVRDAVKAEPFRATSGPGDVPLPFVREERSSRLDVSLPKGRAREEWRVPLGAAQSEPCRDCPPLKASFVLSAGNRVAVVGPEGWALFDTSGHRIDAAKVDRPGSRLDRASGQVVADETRSGDLPPDAKVAVKGGLAVMAGSGGIHIGERAIEGRFDALDVAIDDAGLACAIVRQGDELQLWTVPLSSGAGIGRQRIPGAPRRALGPPVLGRALRVLVLDTGIVALSPDGKRAWERRGVATGGVTITSDDHVLVADGAKVIAIDPKGRTTELYSAPDAVFVTPPIVNASGLLFVASGQSLHALSFQ